MKNKITLLLLIGLLAGCKDKENGLPDLSGGSIAFPGYWGCYFQNVDSIDANGKPWYKPWPSEYNGKVFELKSLNKEHTLYERTTSFLNLNDNNYYKYKDQVYVDPNTGIMQMPIYDNESWSTVKSDTVGIFMGRCLHDSKRIFGYFKYRAYWYCSYCPMGERDRSHEVVVQANLH